MSEFWWAALLAAFYCVLVFAWIFTLIDLFGRLDLSGKGKAAWLLAILLLPLVGVVAYFITRPDRRTEILPASRPREWYPPTPEPAGSPGPSTSEDQPRSP
jgi:hypothetical protein